MIINLGPFGLRLGKAPQQKASLAELQGSRALSSAFGVGPEWAPEVYGNYIATSVPAYRAITVRANAVASAPLVVYRNRLGDKPAPVETTHPVQQLLDKVNPWWTASDLWKATETYLSLWGTAYWFLERQGAQVVGIWPLRPDKMRIIAGSGRDSSGAYISGYLYQDQRPVRFKPEEIVWFRYFNPMSEYAGLSPLAAGRLSLDMGHDALRFNRNFFRNGAVPGDLVFTVQGPVTEEQVNDFYARLEKRHSGASNAHRPMVWDLSQGGKPERVGLTQRDMEFMAALNYSVEDAARIWGVPPPKLYSQTQSIYNNVKQADIEFYTDTISVEWAFLATEVTELLLPILAPGEDLFVAFDTSQVLPLQEALNEQKKADLEEVKNWTLTINEYRAKYNREPVDWGDEPLPRSSPFGGGFGDGQGQGMEQEMPRMAPRVAQNAQEKVLGLFARLLRQEEAKFHALQRQLFEEQERDIIGRLRSEKAVRDIGDTIFQQEEWILRYKRRGLPLLMSILTFSAQEQAQEFGLGAFDPDAPSVKGWLLERTAFWADRVNLETAQLLMAELAEARASGESIPQMQQRIEKVFRFNDMVRSERIARTETLAVANKGHLAVYEQSGVVEETMWLAAQDERTRAAHAEAHRQVAPLGGKFHVGGEMLEGPGLGSDPANNINCRCTTMPILTRRKLLIPSQHYETHSLGSVGNGGKPS